MKKNAFATVLMVFALALISGCASMHIWPDHEKSAESKMAVIEENVGAGLKTGALTPDQVQNMDRIPTLQRDIDDGRISGSLPVREEQEFQARLHSIRRDYLMMTDGGKPISCQERVDVSLRLNSLAREMERYQ